MPVTKTLRFSFTIGRGIPSQDLGDGIFVDVKQLLM
jgi:hypothetical protein